MALNDDGQYLNQLIEGVNYWKNKCSDLCLDLETIKSQLEDDGEKLEEEHDRLTNEYTSVS